MGRQTGTIKCIGLRSAAGPGVAIRRGKECELPREIAEDLAKAGHVKLLDAAGSGAETASLDDERAALIEKAVVMGLGKSSAVKRWPTDKIKSEIAAAEDE